MFFVEKMEKQYYLSIYVLLLLTLEAVDCNIIHYKVPGLCQGKNIGLMHL